MSNAAAETHGTCTCDWGEDEHLKTAEAHAFCPVHDCKGCGYPRGACAGDGGCAECQRYALNGLRSGRFMLPL